ncbi:MAG: DNA-formamidopyrimidine glycosylase family protein [Candidatus Eisenbacteria bacterium]|uniref:Fpg/Nei family DNA glycosylase n=1 Tax=Eiseniibacteriota bacterium TaxID=2212470 RepID=A0A956M3T6_UNCEI|nr:Fpg/Nei family DNA glycosylase [Candidatus Eisenbacteria bacterium]
MPELAEVEFHRKHWNPGIGKRIESVFVRQGKRVFRRTNVRRLVEGLTGAKLLGSETHGKQMLFRFSGPGALGVHLGMTGSLSVEPKNHRPEKHDHLVLWTRKHALVFNDPRLFGEVRFEPEPSPLWWRTLPPQILDPEFTLRHMSDFLDRRSRSPIKAVLLDQAGFPGVGNWMADEILWRAGIHPSRLAGSLERSERIAIRRIARWVCRTALDTIGVDYRDPPRSWLFPHRWEDGGICPRTKVPLVRETIGGRTTCWSPGRQPSPRRLRRT